MILLDVNVVFAAHRIDHPHHAMIRRWMDTVEASAERFVVPTVVWTSFLRLATSRRPFPVATPLVEAFAFLEAVRAHPLHLSLEPGAQHLALLRRLCEESDATGDLVADAVIAAIALEHGCAVASLDRDFARFPSIEHVVPAAR